MHRKSDMRKLPNLGICPLVQSLICWHLFYLTCWPDYIVANVVLSAFLRLSWILSQRIPSTFAKIPLRIRPSRLAGSPKIPTSKPFQMRSEVITPTENKAGPRLAKAHKAAYFHICQTVLTLLPLVFIILAVLSARLHNQPQSKFGDNILEAITSYGPTIFPYMFAGLIGRFMSALALYRIERGAGVAVSLTSLYCRVKLMLLVSRPPPPLPEHCRNHRGITWTARIHHHWRRNNAFVVSFTPWRSKCSTNTHPR
jgi:hypothetical protein